MARTSHHGLHNDVTGFHECAVHEGHSGVKGCGPFALHSPAVGLPGSYQVFDSHAERSLRPAEEDDNDQGDTQHGGKGQAPAQPDCPIRVPVDFVVGQGYILDKREDETSNTESWSDDSPAVLHPGPRPIANHVLNTVI